MKQRITISLNENTLKKVDATIGKNNIQNRSQAIEYLINNQFLTNVKPKAILLGGKKIEPKNIEYTLNKLEEAEVSELIIAGAKNNEMLSKIISSNKTFYKNHIFLKEEKNLGTAGAIKLAENLLTTKFFVVYSDVRCDISLKKMLETHNNSNKLCTMAITLTTKKSEMTDAIKVKDNTIVSFEYKAKNPTNIQNSGIMIFEVEALDYFPTNGTLEYDVLPKLAQKSQITMYLFDNSWEHSD
ncbi:MAG: sugar phosphate nucleotidyltransferase [Candidatus Diapherotrites archaeon]